MPPSPLLSIKPLAQRWETIDPFLFCVYHDDMYPESNGDMGIKLAQLARFCRNKPCLTIKR